MTKINAPKSKTIREGATPDPDHLTSEDKQDIILSLLVDILEDEDVTALPSYIRHVGFDITAIGDPSNLPRAWLAHYRIRQGHYDLERALNDFATWAPIANRIAELKREKEAGVWPYDL